MDFYYASTLYSSWMNFGMYAQANNQSDESVIITFQPFIEGIEPIFSTACINAPVTYDYYKKQLKTDIM